MNRLPAASALLSLDEEGETEYNVYRLPENKESVPEGGHCAFPFRLYFSFMAA